MEFWEQPLLQGLHDRHCRAGHLHGRCLGRHSVAANQPRIGPPHRALGYWLRGPDMRLVYLLFLTPVPDHTNAARILARPLQLQESRHPLWSASLSSLGRVCSIHVPVPGHWVLQNRPDHGGREVDAIALVDEHAFFDAWLLRLLHLIEIREVFLAECCTQEDSSGPIETLVGPWRMLAFSHTSTPAPESKFGEKINASTLCRGSLPSPAQKHIHTHTHQKKKKKQTHCAAPLENPYEVWAR